MPFGSQTQTNFKPETFQSYIYHLPAHQQSSLGLLPSILVRRRPVQRAKSLCCVRARMARSPYFVPVPMEEERSPPEQQGGGGGGGEGQQQLVHSQVRRIQKEDEEIRERLLKLQLLEVRPRLVARRVMRSLSPLRRAGNAAAIPVGD